MSFLSKIRNVFERDRMSRDIAEEMRAHLDEAVEQGRSAEEARRAFGSQVHAAEQSRDVRIIPWLDSLRSDIIFGWRQLNKHKIASAAAILSLALGIGACTSAFRIIDAVLLRPLPIANADRLYNVARTGTGPDGKPVMGDYWAYPSFQLMRAAVKDRAELIAVSFASRMDLTFGSSQDVEKANVQYVSGWMFPAFGLQPSVGRLFTENDDRKPGAHPYAVLSYDYWSRRFARDPKIVGRSLRLGDRLYEIIGVGPEVFTGTETGIVTDIFLPTMMHPGATHDDWTWHRTLALVKPGFAIEPIRAKLDASSRAFEAERAKGFVGMPKEIIALLLNLKVIMQPAAAGASGLQQDYRAALVALAVLVALVLLIACANVANLMTAQAAARAREMALRVSIGAGRWRLIQLVLVESAWMGGLAAAVGTLFAWWSAPFVVGRINPPDNPVRLSLPVDWRVLAFALALTIGVTLLFGVVPALRASGIKPAIALKGGEDPHARRRLMHGLIAAQVAFCFVVLFGAGLFAATFARLSHLPIGFSPDRILNVETLAAQDRPPVFWEQVADHLRSVPGVEKVAIASWPLPGGGGWNGFISVNGGPLTSELAYFVNVSPGWIDAMKLPLLEGRDFRPSDTTPGSAIVNETFVKHFLKGKRPLEVSIAKGNLNFKVVGVVRDAPYRDIKEPIPPVVYVPILTIVNDKLQTVRGATFIVRTSSRNPLALASTIRQEIPRASSEFRVSNIRSEQEIIDSQTVRERLLAMLARFFALVALLLAGIGLYGVLDYTVLRRRREIGIRMALGARAIHVARNVTVQIFAMVLVGAAAGLALGLASARYIESLLYQVKPTDPAMLAIPVAIILATGLIAALPAVIRAVRIDPAVTLRNE